MELALSFLRCNHVSEGTLQLHLAWSLADKEIQYESYDKANPNDLSKDESLMKGLLKVNEKDRMTYEEILNNKCIKNIK